MKWFFRLEYFSGKRKLRKRIDCRPEKRISFSPFFAELPFRREEVLRRLSWSFSSNWFLRAVIYSMNLPLNAKKLAWNDATIASCGLYNQILWKNGSIARPFYGCSRLY
jgi:hypothetical protein